MLRDVPRQPKNSLLAGLIVVAACAAPPPADFDARALDALHAGPELELPASMKFERVHPPTAVIQAGTCAAYSVTIRTPASEETWFVRTAVADHHPGRTGTATFALGDDGTPPIEFDLTGTARLHLQVFDSAGRTVGESLTNELSAEVLLASFAPLCEFSLAHDPRSDGDHHAAIRNLPPPQRRAVLLSSMFLDAAIEIALGAEALAPLLERAVRKPDILSVALNFASGIQAAVRLGNTRRWAGPSPRDQRGGYMLPIEVIAFGKRALNVTALIADHGHFAPPTTGIVSVAAQHPDDAQVEVRIRLQALGQLLPVERVRVFGLTVAEL